MTEENCCSIEFNPVKGSIKTATDILKTGGKNVTQEQKAERLKICESCDHFLKDSRRCDICKCYLDLKTKFQASECPINKWNQITLEENKMDTKKIKELLEIVDLKKIGLAIGGVFFLTNWQFCFEFLGGCTFLYFLTMVCKKGDESVILSIAKAVLDRNGDGKIGISDLASVSKIED